MSRKFNPHKAQGATTDDPLHNLAATYVAQNELDDELIGEIETRLGAFVKGLRNQFAHDMTGALVEHGHDLMHQVLEDMGVQGWPTLVRMGGTLELGAEVRFTREDENKDKTWVFEGVVVGYFLRKDQEPRYRVVYSGEKIKKGLHDAMSRDELEVI